MDNIMTQNIIITIVSIVLSAFFSWFFTRRSNRRYKIVHFMINSFDIGKGLSNEFPFFKLSNNGVELSNNVMTIKGGFINVSSKDIGETGKQMVFQMVLPEGCEVKAIRIKSGTEDLGIIQDQIIEKGNNDKNIIPFCIDGVFKVNEYFEYTAIVELPSDMSDLDYKQFKFKHRITNADISNTYLGPEKSFKVSFFSRGITMNVNDLKASVFGLLTSAVVDVLIIALIIRSGIFDVLGLIILIYCVSSIVSYFVAFSKIMIQVKNHNHILQIIFKEKDL